MPESKTSSTEATSTVKTLIIQDSTTSASTVEKDENEGPKLSEFVNALFHAFNDLAPNNFSMSSLPDTTKSTVNTSTNPSTTLTSTEKVVSTEVTKAETAETTTQSTTVVTTEPTKAETVETVETVVMTDATTVSTLVVTTTGTTTATVTVTTISTINEVEAATVTTPTIVTTTEETSETTLSPFVNALFNEFKEINTNKPELALVEVSAKEAAITTERGTTTVVAKDSIKVKTAETNKPTLSPFDDFLGKPQVLKLQENFPAEIAVKSTTEMPQDIIPNTTISVISRDLPTEEPQDLSLHTTLSVFARALFSEFKNVSATIKPKLLPLLKNSSESSSTINNTNVTTSVNKTIKPILNVFEDTLKNSLPGSSKFSDLLFASFNNSTLEEEEEKF